MKNKVIFKLGFLVEYHSRRTCVFQRMVGLMFRNKDTFLRIFINFLIIIAIDLGFHIGATL
jgi:hypothetical protein